MKKSIAKQLIAVFLIVISFIGCNNESASKKSAAVKTSAKSIEAKEVKINVTPLDTTLSEELINKTKSKGQQAVADVAKYFNFDKSDNYEIQVRENGFSFCPGSSTTILTKWMLETNHAPIVDELTHLLSNSNPSMSAGSSFFSEGIAVLMQEKYGDKAVFPFVDNTSQELTPVSVEDSVKLIKNNYIPLQYLIDNNGLFCQAIQKNPTSEDLFKRKVPYIEAGSFFIYLDNVYGQEKIRKLYYSPSKLDFKGCFGKDLDSLEKEYLAYFKLK